MLFCSPGLRPRRTLRTVLWTAEEQGGIGAQQYYNFHKVWLNVLYGNYNRKYHKCCASMVELLLFGCLQGLTREREKTLMMQ